MANDLVDPSSLIKQSIEAIRGDSPTGLLPPVEINPSPSSGLTGGSINNWQTPKTPPTAERSLAEVEAFLEKAATAPSSLTPVIAGTIPVVGIVESDTTSVTPEQVREARELILQTARSRQK